MATLTFRLGADLLARLDAFVEARGLEDRSQAVRTAILEAVMDADERKTVPDRGELLDLLGSSAREGSVTAMKALLEEHRRDHNDEPKKDEDPIDELAGRRAQRTA